MLRAANSPRPYLRKSTWQKWKVLCHAVARERYLELSPKHWAAIRERLRPEELAAALSAFEIPAAEPATVPAASAAE
jgi:hypothetical protein